MCKTDNKITLPGAKIFIDYLTIVVKTVFHNKVYAVFCGIEPFLTLLYRLWPNRHAAVFISSLLYALAVYKTFTFLKLDYGLNYLTALALGTRFLSGLILGYIYVLRGLYPVILFKLLVCARLFFLI